MYTVHLESLGRIHDCRWIASIEILEIKKAGSQKNPAIKLTYQINKLFIQLSCPLIYSNTIVENMTKNI